MILNKKQYIKKCLNTVPSGWYRQPVSHCLPCRCCSWVQLLQSAVGRRGSSHAAAGSVPSFRAVPEILGDLKTQWQCFLPRQDGSATASMGTPPAA